MKGSVNNDLGTISIRPEAIAKYAGSVAVECFGIVGMAAKSMKDGLVRLLKKIVSYGLMRLFYIPRTAARRAQDAHYLS